MMRRLKFGQKCLLAFAAFALLIAFVGAVYLVHGLDINATYSIVTFHTASILTNVFFQLGSIIVLGIFLVLLVGAFTHELSMKMTVLCVALLIAIFCSSVMILGGI